MSSKVRIKCDSMSQDKRLKLLKILEQFRIKCSKLISPLSVPNEYVAFLHDISDVDKLFTDNCINAFTALNCSPIMPAQLKAKRSVIMKKVDDYIYQYSEGEILTEINRQNSLIQASSVFKFPNIKMLKITLSNQLMTDICLNDGLKLFSLHINHRYFDKKSFMMFEYATNVIV